MVFRKLQFNLLSDYTIIRIIFIRIPRLKKAKNKNHLIIMLRLTCKFFPFKPQFFFHQFLNTMLYFMISQKIKDKLTCFRLLYFRLWVKNIIIKNILKIAFSLACRFLSLRMVRFISANLKELYKNYLTLKTPVLIRILRFTET